MLDGVGGTWISEGCTTVAVYNISSPHAILHLMEHHLVICVRLEARAPNKEGWDGINSGRGEGVEEMEGEAGSGERRGR